MTDGNGDVMSTAVGDANWRRQTEGASPRFMSDLPPVTTWTCPATGGNSPQWHRQQCSAVPRRKVGVLTIVYCGAGSPRVSKGG